MENFSGGWKLEDKSCINLKQLMGNKVNLWTWNTVQ